MGVELALLGAALYSTQAQKEATERASRDAKRAAEKQARATESAAQQAREQSAQEAKAMQMAREQEMARQQQERTLLEQIAADKQGEPEEVAIDIGEGADEDTPQKRRRQFYSPGGASAGLNI